MSKPQLPARRVLAFALLLAPLLLSGCSDNADTVATVRRAMAIEHGEECHLCGMIIENQPGPKGQLYEREVATPHKFCSTRDLFAYLLDPEHKHRIESVFVHDMAVTPWDHPDDQTYIDARQAWYVVGSKREGGMGPTLASFADRAVAELFIEEFGGRLYRFDQIDLDLISSMSPMAM
ncbi:nitrous oxide reductase accessory protein NosL [Marinobacterium sp. D7]|uniref:nitrous oxide reductase accessory protein NosL n=1 Tax=Marinobacterium ramblicola TaxID=2849041 RepID=UPI001C2D26CE|nr:nitrous oxide reductase accessory protein NosL [Marinobacterium ramblicola]MBV1790320.1 nitrous oxide reductase accessory protein NosL [Marinobacterium ramblicola]